MKSSTSVLVEQLDHNQTNRCELMAELYGNIQRKRAELRQMEKEYRRLASDYGELTEPHETSSARGGIQ